MKIIPFDRYSSKSDFRTDSLRVKPVVFVSRKEGRVHPIEMYTHQSCRSSSGMGVVAFLKKALLVEGREFLPGTDTKLDVDYEGEVEINENELE